MLCVPNTRKATETKANANKHAEIKKLRCDINKNDVLLSENTARREIHDQKTHDSRPFKTFFSQSSYMAGDKEACCSKILHF